MKNIINILFLFILGSILLLTFWNDISPNAYGEKVCQEAYEPMGQTLWYPLGCDENRNDYAVTLSEAFKYNINISILGTIIFMFTGILIGLSKGLINISSSNKKHYLQSPLYYIKFLADYLTEIFLSVPILIVLIFSYYLFQLLTIVDIIETTWRLHLTFIMLGFFSSPLLSLPIEKIILGLKKEEFILAAKASGISKVSLVCKHILYYESKGVIIIQSINFFLFSIMMEIFLTYWKGPSVPGQTSLGFLIKNNMFNIQLLFSYPEFVVFQEKVVSFSPFIFIILLSLTSKWLGERIQTVTNTQ